MYLTLGATAIRTHRVRCPIWLKLEKLLSATFFDNGSRDEAALQDDPQLIEVENGDGLMTAIPDNPNNLEVEGLAPESAVVSATANNV